MMRTPPTQREKPAPPAPKRLAGRPRSHTEVRKSAEQTPCPTRSQETSTFRPEDTETQNSKKYGTVAAGSPLHPPPKATPAIDPTPPKKYRRTIQWPRNTNSRNPSTGHRANHRRK